MAELIGVDYSVQSSGLHHPIFDAVWVQPAWGEMDLSTYADQIRERLSEPDVCWISGLDAEVEWLADQVGPLANLLLPSAEARSEVEKPVIAAAADIGMRVPEWIPAASDAESLHKLGRRCGWRLWVKGRYHEAYSARNFEAVGMAIRQLRKHWPLQDLFVQGHIAGTEKAYTFCSYDGDLLEAVEVDKRALSTRGKTWGASVSCLRGEARARLAAFARRTRWTGGGEIEFLRSSSGEQWLIDFNPRFPAYIHGVTLCGWNLPALLVGRSLDSPVELLTGHSGVRQFIRTITEVPVRRGFRLPPLAEDGSDEPKGGKHPSRQPALVEARRSGLGLSEREDPPDEREDPPEVSVRMSSRSADDDTSQRMLTLARSVERTPQRVRDIAALDASLSAVNAAAALGPLRVLPSISVKTDPSSEVVGRAIASGWLAETISPAEARFAASLGAKPETTVLNGPLAGPTTAALSRDLGAPIKAAFADSIEALDTLLASGSVVVPGYRVRPPSVESRFGVDVADFDTFTALITLLRRAERPYGVHFHYASDIVGPNRWFELLEEVIGWAATVAEVIGHGPTLFDIGGGWYHGDYYELFLPRLSEVQERIRNAFATVKELIIEPGKAVSATSAILVTEVVEVRDGGIEAEVVVDASIADLPMADLYAHPVFHMRQTQSLGWLGAGRGRLLGAICMETDVLARAVSFPSPPAVGDRLAFLNAGAYDASMAWPFASGEHRDGRPTL